MPRWNFPNAAQPQLPADLTINDYLIEASWIHHAGAYYGHLKLIRKPDKHVIYPFLGAPPIGPFTTSEAAKQGADATALQLIRSDMQNPEATW